MQFKTVYQSKLLLLQFTDISHDRCFMVDNADLRENITVPDGELGAELRVVSEADIELVVSCVD